MKLYLSEVIMVNFYQSSSYHTSSIFTPSPSESQQATRGHLKRAQQFNTTLVELILDG
jgi:hypothetical protein